MLLAKPETAVRLPTNGAELRLAMLLVVAASTYTFQVRQGVVPPVVVLVMNVHCVGFPAAIAWPLRTGFPGVIMSSAVPNILTMTGIEVRSHATPVAELPPVEMYEVF